MDARKTFKEGWIMLLRPFKFAELEKPLQKMTILYAYSEKPIIKMELTVEGEKLRNEAFESIGKNFSLIGNNKWKKRYNEDEDDYEDRVDKALEILIRDHSTVEIYEGEIVQCYVNNEMCRFYPEEYTVIRQETFEHVLITEDYTMDIDNPKHFERKEIAERLHYIRSRGIDKPMAERMASAGAKDAVIFRPSMDVLEMFCRPHEIY